MFITFCDITQCSENNSGFLNYNGVFTGERVLVGSAVASLSIASLHW
jgi:hypothetical protein